MSKYIMVYDSLNRTMDGYKDISEVAKLAEVSVPTLKKRLGTGIQWINGMFIGYGELHKSNRGS